MSKLVAMVTVVVGGVVSMAMVTGVMFIRGEASFFTMMISMAFMFTLCTIGVSGIARLQLDERQEAGGDAGDN